MILQHSTMSAALTTSVRKLPRDSGVPRTEPRPVRILEWAVTIPTIALLGTLTTLQWREVTSNPTRALLWVALVAVVDLAPVLYTEQLHVTMSLPLLLAAGILMAPVQVGLIAFAGSCDPREFRLRVGLGHALFNRCLIAACSISAAAVFHAAGVSTRHLVGLIGIAVLATLIDGALDLGLVSLAGSLASGSTYAGALQQVMVGSPLEFVVTYLVFGLGALPIAVATEHLGIWGLGLSLIPLAIARQMFAHRKEAASARKAVQQSERAVLAMAERIADERRDERSRVAMCLHDDVLGRLFRVRLTGDVLRQDLEQGRLLDLEADLPELTHATADASESLRRLIRDLRRGPLGAGTVAPTVRLLLDELAAQTRADVLDDLLPVDASPLVQLVIYQIAREALENCLHHSEATEIRVRLYPDGGVARLVVADNGRGFSPSAIDATAHFGLQLMRERAETVGGVVHIDSRPGAGTIVSARFPMDGVPPA